MDINDKKFIKQVADDIILFNKVYRVMRKYELADVLNIVKVDKPALKISYYFIDYDHYEPTVDLFVKEGLIYADNDGDIDSGYSYEDWLEQMKECLDEYPDLDKEKLNELKSIGESKMKKEENKTNLKESVENIDFADLFNKAISYILELNHSGDLRDILEDMGLSEQEINDLYEFYEWDEYEEFIANQATDKVKENCQQSDSKLEESLGDTAEDIIDNIVDSILSDKDDYDDLDSVITEDINDSLIYSEDILTLAQHYGVVDDSELIDKFYDNLYSDVYNKVIEKQGQEVEDEDDIEDFDDDASLI